MRKDQLPSSSDRILIWDKPVRIFHWLLVAAIIVAGTTGFLMSAPWLGWHIAGGATAGVLVVWRIIWGFTGTTYSRFRSFIYSPRQIFDHMRGIIHPSPTEEHEAGHNPLGALMVFALLAVVLAMVASGTTVLGGMFKQGPLKSFVSFATGQSVLSVHASLAMLLLVLIILHLGGVIFESIRSQDNLARDMVTGYKNAAQLHLQKRVKAMGWLAVIFSLGLGAVAVFAISQLNAKAPYGVPTVPVDLAWKQECSDCHMAFPPTLLPASSWQKLMAGLDNHFGENADLDPAATSEITQYLVAHSAETSDTLPANMFHKVNPAAPLQITQTPFWQRMHGDFPPAVFTQKSVGSKQNCLACHKDAESGMFAPQNIAVPKS